MKYIHEARLADFRREMRDNPSTINYETKSGKTALALAISRLVMVWDGFLGRYTMENTITWRMTCELIERNARLGNWVNFSMFDNVLAYMKKIRMRRLACAASLRTLMGLKRFKKTSILNGANKDIMLLIFKPMMHEAGRRVEWDYEEREREKRRLK